MIFTIATFLKPFIVSSGLDFIYILELKVFSKRLSTSRDRWAGKMYRNKAGVKTQED